MDERCCSGLGCGGVGGQQSSVTATTATIWTGGSLVEVVGRAGAGKTQLALQMAIRAALPWAAAAAAAPSLPPPQQQQRQRFATLYIDTEGKSSVVDRLHEMTVQQATLNSHLLHHSNDETVVTSVLENIIIRTVSTMEELQHFVECTLEDEIVARQNPNASIQQQQWQQQQWQWQQFPIRYVVLDSIAAPVRKEAWREVLERATAMLALAQTLKRIAHDWNLIVMIINQVNYSPTTTTIASSNNINNNGTNHIQAPAWDSASGPRAALGMAWHHCVTTRLEMDFQSHHHEQAANNHQFFDMIMGNTAAIYAPGDPQISGSILYDRTIRIVKSNVVATGDPIPFRITNAGLIDN